MFRAISTATIQPVDCLFRDEESARSRSGTRPPGQKPFDQETPDLKTLSLYLALFALGVAPLAAQPGRVEVPPPADLAAPPADALRSDSGLVTRILTPGSGDIRPAFGDTVSVHFTSWTTDGKMFQTSGGKEPVVVPVNALLPGWREGILQMRVGEHRRFWIPEALAYAGAEGRPSGTIVFDVHLVEVMNPQRAPEDVAAVPADAEITPSGLASRVLRKGTGNQHPRGSQEVTVHYTGWTTDGQMFDSSVLRGTPATFPLTGVIRGWTEGLKLMVPGEKRRFWIPQNLAYRGQRGKPQGMLVFDVELLSIH